MAKIKKWQMSPLEATIKKKRIKNPDGTYSSERSITISTERGYINIPTIYNGKQLGHKKAIEQSKKTGIRYPEFKTLDEALNAAALRTMKLGMYGTMFRKRKRPGF
jgi:membrane peptidoglycan carboxypeptidase